MIWKRSNDSDVFKDTLITTLMSSDSSDTFSCNDIKLIEKIPLSISFRVFVFFQNIKFHLFHQRIFMTKKKGGTGKWYNLVNLVTKKKYHVEVIYLRQVDDNIGDLNWTLRTKHFHATSSIYFLFAALFFASTFQTNPDSLHIICT